MSNTEFSIERFKQINSPILTSCVEQAGQMPCTITSARWVLAGAQSKGIFTLSCSPDTPIGLLGYTAENHCLKFKQPGILPGWV